jgi:hypothetical protein
MNREEYQAVLGKIFVVMSKSPINIEDNQIAKSLYYAEKEIGELRNFIKNIMAHWPDGGVDGGDLQDIAESHGILKQESVSERCGENCSCAEYGAFPTQCFKKIYWLIDKELDESRSEWI